MEDHEVADLLRSGSKLVAIEAPAGCGKTHQGALYAKDVTATLKKGRVLILTHTHAARIVFAARTKGVAGKVEIRTIDSFLAEIAAAYHKTLSLPADVAAFARDTGSFDVVARECRRLLEGSETVAAVVSRRYPVVICDEHQDASSDQHACIMAIFKAGSTVRFFGDPMQIIYRKTRKSLREAISQWSATKAVGSSGRLKTPHRWNDEAPELGRWVLKARDALESGHAIELGPAAVPGLHIIFAENSSAMPRKSFAMSREHRAEMMSALPNRQQNLLVLSGSNDSVHQIHSFFGRSISIWEGHTRESLTSLVKALHSAKGNAPLVTEAFLIFVYATITGFTESVHGKRLRREVSELCSAKARGLPAALQSLGRCIVHDPDHRGVASALSLLRELARTERGFGSVHFNMHREVQEAIALGDFTDVTEGAREIERRRTHGISSPPRRSLSTIHKAKGLEADHVLALMCDASSFSDTDYKRRLLYVAVSRPRKSLTLVLSRKMPSPLFHW
ncbi:ATP-dependent helicase [Rhizobium johnstonii]|uniref:ATP-dependent helicase n=1 Tax=Rhizobium johnstonii TaxID=3019933 RepID=UPI003F96414B